MPVCDQCKQVFEELEKWGIISLCYDCARRYERTLPKRAKRKTPDIIFDEPEFPSGNMCYSTTKNTIEIRKIGENEKWLCTALTHEFTHYLLHRLMGVKCTFQYDNISPNGQLDFIMV